MTISDSEQRMIDNEVVFRRHNERFHQGLEELKQLAKENNQPHFVSPFDAPLQFFCECSDEKCGQRVTITPDRYAKIHRHRSRFLIVCGHDVPAIEKVVKQENEFCVVEKLPKATA